MPELYDVDLTLNEPVGNGGQQVVVVYEVERGIGGSRYREDLPDRDHLTIHHVFQEGEDLRDFLPAEIGAEIAMAVSEDWRSRKLNQSVPDLDPEGEPY